VNVKLGEELDQTLRPGTVHATDGHRTVRAEVADADRLAVSLRRLRVDSPGRTVAEAVAGLPETMGRALGAPLEVIEVAPALGGAVLRSRPDGEREYWEVRTTGEAAELERWRVRPEGREAVAFPITRRDLRRLVEAM